MKVPYRKIFLFLAILFSVLFLMNLWMDQEHYPHVPLQYDEVFHPKDGGDVIILGASQAAHGINPKYLEPSPLKIYNFSLNGAPPSFYLNWYRKIFHKYYPRPAYVVYAVHWVMFDDHLLSRRLEQDSKYFPRRFLLEELRDPKNWKDVLMNRFSLIKERKRLMPRLFKKKPDEVYLRNKYYRGFIPFETRRSLDKRDVVHPKTNPAEVKAFEALLDDFEKEEIKVIFVHVPAYLPGREYADVSGGMQLLKRIAGERKIPFLDYETERPSAINMDRELFSDWTHLNEKGSTAFSTLLKKDLDGLIH
jgi:hypothetical protein